LPPAAIRAGKDLARGTGQHCLGAVDADRRVVDVGVVDPGDPLPGFAAVTAATPAHTIRWSDGPTVSAVTRGMRTFGHSSAISAGSLSQWFPPSVDRKSAAGRVPAKIVWGFVGSNATFHTCTAFIGESSLSKCSPPSSLR